MFTEALFTMAKTWKQPKCPSTEEWLKKMWYIDTVKYYSAKSDIQTINDYSVLSISHAIFGLGFYFLNLAPLIQRLR